MTGNGTAKLRPTPIRVGSKVRAVYDRAHLAWRAGAIRSWNYGKRSPEDSTVVWVIDGTEYDAKDLPGVASAIDAACSRAGVAHAVFGDAWCGYRSLAVTYVDGAGWVERFDSAIGVVVRDRVAAEVAA
ncbi:MAG TPA: hypothetical protein VIK61_01855 [Acidimicrobiia bacterium]